jgi:hypothetical protein
VNAQCITEFPEAVLSSHSAQQFETFPLVLQPYYYRLLEGNVGVYTEGVFAAGLGLMYAKSVLT